MVKRRPSKIALVALAAAVIVGILVAIKTAGPGIIEHLAIERLARLGVPSAEFHIEEISYDRVVVTGVRVGEDADLEIPDVRAVFSPIELFKARMSEIQISGLVLRLRVIGDGLSFGALEPLFLAADLKEGIASVGRWPVDAVNVTGSVIEIRSPFETTYLPISGRIHQTPDRTMRLENARIEFVHPNLKIVAAANGTLEKDGRLSARMSIEGGTIEFGSIRAGIAGGWFEAAGRLDAIRSLSGKGEFSVGEVTAPLDFKPKTSLRVSLRDQRLVSTVRLDDSAHQVAANLAVTISDLFGENPGFQLSAGSAVADFSRLPPQLDVSHLLVGAARLDTSLDFTFDEFVSLAEAPDESAFLDRMPKISIRLNATDVGRPDDAVRADIQGQLAVEADDDVIAVRIRDDLRLIVREMRKGVFKTRFGPVYQPDSVGPLRFALSSRGDLLRISRAEAKELSVGLDGRLSVSGGGLPKIEGEIDAMARAAESDLSVRAISIKRLNVDVAKMVVGGVQVIPEDLVLSLDATPESGRGEYRLAGLVDGLVPGLARFANGQIVLAGQLSFGRDWLSVSVDDCGLLQAEHLEFLGVLKLNSHQSFCLVDRHDEGFLARLLFDAKGPRHIDAGLAIRSKGSRTELRLGDDLRINLNGEKNSLDFTGFANLRTGSAAATTTVHVEEVIMPDQRLVMGPVKGKGELTVREDQSSIALKAIVGRIEHVSDPPIFAAATARLEAVANDRTAKFSGTLGVRDGPVIAEFDGEHTFVARRGRLTARLLPLTLHPTQKTLQVLFPATDQWIDQISGIAIGVGNADWADGQIVVGVDSIVRDVRARSKIDALPGLGGQVEVDAAQLAVSGQLEYDFQTVKGRGGKILIENAYVEADVGRAEKINGVVTLDRLWPVVTAPQQHISIARLDVGVPLSDGLIEFDVFEDGHVTVHEARFVLAEGEVIAKQVEISQPPSRVDVPIEIRDLDVETLVDLLSVAGITATGKLSGRIPIAIRGNDFRVVNGEVHALGSGALSYRPENAATLGATNAYTEMALDILSDFHYSDFRVDVTKAVNEDLKFGFVIQGANPSFHDGFPVELRLNVFGEVGKLIRNEILTYSIPQIVRDRMLRFGTQ